MHLKVHETAADAESAPILRRDSPTSALVRNGSEELYGTFDDSHKGK